MQVMCAGCGALVKEVPTPMGAPEVTYGQCAKCSKETFRSKPEASAEAVPPYAKKA